MDRAIAALAAAGAKARPSPLGFKHIKLVGRYQFARPEVIAAGAWEHSSVATREPITYHRQRALGRLR